jgi:uncharacterized protein (TIGR00297 family)
VTQLALAAALAAAVALFAYRARTLTFGGAVAAFVVGAAVFGAGGWRAAAVLFAFFIPSAVLSRVGSQRKRTLGDEKQGPRNAWQVFANGGTAAVCIVAASSGFAPLATAFAGAFAAASADTWGTEIGMLSRRAPVSILTFRPVAAGLSGGVTPLGSIASVGGALCVALVTGLVHLGPLWGVALGGIAGAIADSLLGASLQALRWCPNCGRECEMERHSCGTPTVLRRGIAWIANDAVNFIATICGALVAAAAAGV